MKIGILPGSFNPVHVGHLTIANYLAEYEGYDQTWFLITPQNPLKKQSDLIDQDFRLELLNEAVAGYDKFIVSTIEWSLPRPSYTINTLQKLRVTYPNDTFELIIGSDNWATFHRWKDYQLILKNFKVVIYPRRGSDRITLYHPNVRLCKGAPKIEVSSTFIRTAIATGKDVRFYMPVGLFEKTVQSGYIQPAVEEEPTDHLNMEQPSWDTIS
ncbi:MAG: Nicotinate-nucleotide adenylyltransferase [Candidatus Ordinivivax streblomastigis]|uniref:Probable nicotinate-nucleotide adenylyltransferase n=1 Tax=Candidatus Ordinivivax streblomastigis TaxID=2540710 RepID=A0A5M8P5I6_9BACT|nr:MAG: Nicotinate-nucleotide adenylyltransferase [Candidatus Ordinivivax streblomastigis]